MTLKTCLIVGRGLIGSALALPDHDVIRVSHMDAHDAIRAISPDLLINAAIDPMSFAVDQDPDAMLDVAYARLLRPHARLVMLSSRKVYAPAEQWGAIEYASSDPVTAYGRNKRRSEVAALQLLGHDRLLILRLPNVYSFELDEKRSSFFAMMLRSLMNDDEIRFDCDPATRRDFLFVDDFVVLLARCVATVAGGTFNVGYGKPVACADIAATLIGGYGGGRIVSASDRRIDEFYLDNRKLASAIPMHGLVGNVHAILELGQALRGLERHPVERGDF